VDQLGLLTDQRKDKNQAPAAPPTSPGQ
jgi:hypothetical protein